MTDHKHKPKEINNYRNALIDTFGIIRDLWASK